MRERPATRMTRSPSLRRTTATMGIAIAAMAGAGGPATGRNAETAPTPARAPATDCRVHVNFDRNAEFAGYVDAAGQCLPFTPVGLRPPEGYPGDFYVNAFTDAALRTGWATCRQDPVCADSIRAATAAYMEPDRRVTGAVDGQGLIDPEGVVDLQAIRRPAWFGRPGLDEPIAVADARTSIVEFTLPADPHERLQLGRTAPVKVRGWYIDGAGVAGADGVRRRALVVMNNGGGFEITALDDPRSTLVQRDATGSFRPTGPDGVSEQAGARVWRGFAAALNSAGFDILALDRRGNGLSSGVSANNTAEQARDIFRELNQMESGEGLRLRTPDGAELGGSAAAGRLMGGLGAREIPTILAGYSRGSYATSWAMHKNFVTDCDDDLPERVCRPPLAYPNIRGAILYGSNPAGVGYRFQARSAMVEALMREDYSTAYYPDGDVFAHIGDWPGVLIVRGLWDSVEGLEGTLEAWRRAREPKDIFVFRGPHLLNTQSPENMRLAAEHMVRFATAAVLRQDQVVGAGHPRDLRDLVLGTPPYWETTNDPDRPSSP
jgi:pimeloyl-ACP methyl ester carboxylesterase